MLRNDDVHIVHTHRGYVHGQSLHGGAACGRIRPCGDGRGRVYHGGRVHAHDDLCVHVRGQTLRDDDGHAHPCL